MKAAVTRMNATSWKHFYDEQQRLFISGERRQVSFASNVWLALAQVLPEPQSASAL